MKTVAHGVTCWRRWFVLGFTLLAPTGCTSAPRPTAAAAWTVDKELGTSEQLVALVTTNNRPTSSAALDDLNRRLHEAQILPLTTRAAVLADVGIAALFAGCRDLAAKALDEAIEIMGGISNDPDLVARVLSTEGREQERVFKGEPHERALVFLFRGVLYLSDGDFGNARACFRSGEIQDSRIIDGEAEWGEWHSLRYLMVLTDFWEWGVLPDATMLNAPEGLQLHRPSAGDDCLLVVVSGFPPRKILLRDDEGSRLSYFPAGPGPVRVTVTDASTAEPRLGLELPAEDVFVQAASHGRREMDAVLEAKRRYHDSALSTANVSEGVGLVAAQFGLLGLPVAVASAAITTSKRNSAAETSKAPDLRQLSCIPGYLYLGTLRTMARMQLTMETSDGEEFYSTVLEPPQSPGRTPRIITCRAFR